MSGTTEVADCGAAQAQLQASPSSPLPALLSADPTTEQQQHQHLSSSSPQPNNHITIPIVSSRNDDALLVSQSHTGTNECMSETVLLPSASAARTASLPCSLSPETDLGSTPASPQPLAASSSSSSFSPSHLTTQPHTTTITSAWPAHTNNTTTTTVNSGVSKGRTSTSLAEHHSPLPKAAGPHTTPVSPSSSRGSSHTRSAGGGGSARQLSSAVAAVYKRALVAANKHTAAGASSSSSSSAPRRPLRTTTATTMNRNTASTPSPKRARKATPSSLLLAAATAAAHEEMKETSQSSCSTSPSAHHTLSHTLVGATSEAPSSSSLAAQRSTVDTQSHTSCTAGAHTRQTAAATPPPPQSSLLPRTNELLATSASDSARTSRSMTSVHTTHSSSLASSRTSVVWYSLLLRFKGLLDRQEAVLERVSRLSTIQTTSAREAGEEIPGCLAHTGRDAQGGSSAPQLPPFLAPSSSSSSLSPSLLLPVHSHMRDDGPTSSCPVTSHDAACLFAAYHHSNDNSNGCPTHSPPAQHVLAQRMLSEEETKAATRLLHAHHHHHPFNMTAHGMGQEAETDTTHASSPYQTKDDDMTEATRAAAELTTHESSELVTTATVVVRPVLDEKWNVHRTAHTNGAEAEEYEDVQAAKGRQGTPPADLGMQQQQQDEEKGKENAEQMISPAHLNLSARKPPALQPIFDLADTALDTESSSVTLSLDVTQPEGKPNTTATHKKEKAVRGGQTHGLVVSDGAHREQQQQQQQPEREQSGEMLDFTSTNSTTNTNTLREGQELRRLALHHSGSQTTHKPEGRQESEDEMTVMMMTTANLTTEPGLASRTNSMTNLALQPSASYASNTTTLYGGVNGGSFASATISPLSQPMSSRNELLNVSLLNSNTNGNLGNASGGAGNACGTPAMLRGFSSVFYATSPSSAATNRSMTPRQLISPAANAASNTTASNTLRPPPLVFPSPATGTTNTSGSSSSTMTSIAANTAAMNPSVSSNNINRAVTPSGGNVSPSTARTTSPAKASFLARVTFPGALPSHRTATTNTTANTNTTTGSGSGNASHVLPLADAATTNTSNIPHTTGAASAAGTTPSTTTALPSISDFSPSSASPIALAMNRANGSNADEAAITLTSSSSSSSSPSASSMEGEARPTHTEPADIARGEEEEEEGRRNRRQQSTETTTQPHGMSHTSSTAAAAAADAFTRPKSWPAPPIPTMRRPPIVPHSTPFAPNSPHAAHNTTNNHTNTGIAVNHAVQDEGAAYSKARIGEQIDACKERSAKTCQEQDMSSPDDTDAKAYIAEEHTAAAMAEAELRRSDSWRAFELRHGQEHLPAAWLAPSAHVSSAAGVAAAAAAQLTQSANNTEEEHEGRGQAVRVGPAVLLNETHSFHSDSEVYSSDYSGHSESSSSTSNSSSNAEYVRDEAENRHKRARRYDELEEEYDNDDNDEEEEDAEETEEEEGDDSGDVQQRRRAPYYHHRHRVPSSFSSPGAAAAGYRGSNAASTTTTTSLSPANSAVCTSLAAAYLSIHSHRYAPRRHGAGGRRVITNASTAGRSAAEPVRTEEGDAQDENKAAAEHHTSFASADVVTLASHQRQSKEEDKEEEEEGVYSPTEQPTGTHAEQTATANEEEEDAALSRAAHTAGRTTSVPEADTLWDLNSSLRELSRVEAQNIIALSSRAVRRPRRQRRVAGRRPHDWPAATALFSSLNRESTNVVAGDRMGHKESAEAAEDKTHSIVPNEAVVSVPELNTTNKTSGELCISDSPVPPPLSSPTHSHRYNDVHHGPLSAHDDDDDIPRTETHTTTENDKEEKNNAPQASATTRSPAAAASSSSSSSSPSMSRTPSVLSMSGHQANAKQGSCATSLHRSTSTPYTSVVQTTASMSGADEAGQNMRQAIQQKQEHEQQQQSHRKSKLQHHHEVMLSARSGEELRLSQECASVEMMPRNNTNITNNTSSRFRSELQDAVRTDSSTAAPAMALVSSSFSSSSTNAKDAHERVEQRAETDHAGSAQSETRGQTRWTEVMDSTGTLTNAANPKEDEEEEDAVNECTPASQVVPAEGAGNAALSKAHVPQDKSTTNEEKEEKKEKSTAHSAANEKKKDVLPSPAGGEYNKEKEEEGSPLPPPPLPSRTPTQTPTNQSTTLTTLISTHEHAHHHHHHHKHHAHPPPHHEQEDEDGDAMRAAHVHHRTSSPDVVNHGSLHEGSSSASALTTGRSSFSSASSSHSSSSSSSLSSSDAQPRTHRTHRTPRFRFLHTPRGTSRPNALGNRSRSKAIASVVAAAVAQTQSRRAPNTHTASATNSHNASVTSSSMSKTLHKLGLNNTNNNTSTNSNNSTTQPHLTLADFEDVAGLSAVLSRDLSVMEKSLHTFTEGQLAQTQHTQPYGFDGGQLSKRRRRRRRQLCEGLSGSNTPTAKGRRPTHRTAQPAASLTSLPRERHAVHARTATYTSVNTTSSTSKEAEVHTTQIAAAAAPTPAHTQTTNNNVAAHARSHTTASWYKRRGKYYNTEGQSCPEHEAALHRPHLNNTNSSSKTGQALAGTNAVSHVHPHRPVHRTRPGNAMTSGVAGEKNKEGAQVLPAQHFESVHTQPRTSAVSETSNPVHATSGGNAQEGQTSTGELPSVVRELFMTPDQPFPSNAAAALTHTAVPQASPPRTHGVEEDEDNVVQAEQMKEDAKEKQEKKEEDEKRVGSMTAVTSHERQDAPKEPSNGRGQSQHTTHTTTSTNTNIDDNYNNTVVEEQSSRHTNAEQSATRRSESRQPPSSSSFLSPTAAAAALLTPQANTELSTNTLSLALAEGNDGTDKTMKDSIEGEGEAEEGVCEVVHHDRVVSQDSEDKTAMVGLRRSGQNITSALHHFASHPTRHGKAAVGEKSLAAAVGSTRRRYQQDMTTGRLRSSRHGQGHTSTEVRNKDSANTSNALLPLSHNTSSASSMSYVGNTNTSTATATAAAPHEGKHHHLVTSQPYTAAGAVCDTVLLLHRPANSAGNTIATTISTANVAATSYATPLPQAHRTRTTTSTNVAAAGGAGGEYQSKCSPLRSVSASATDHIVVKTSEGRTEMTGQANTRAHMTASPTTWRRAAAATNTTTNTNTSTSTSTNKHTLPMTASTTALLYTNHINNNTSGVTARAATVLPQRNASPMRFPSALAGGRLGVRGSPLHTRRVASRQGTGPTLVHTGNINVTKGETGGEMSCEGGDGAGKEAGQVPRQHVEMPTTTTASTNAAGATRNVRPALL